TIAGNGQAGFNGDGQATSSQLHYPTGVAVDSSGNVYIADQHNHRVRKVSPEGQVWTIAGNGQAGFNGDGQATSSQLHYPTGVAVDSSGNVYIADYHNHRIRKVSPDGRIRTVAGNGTAGFDNDGQATSSRLHYPTGVAVDSSGNVYIADPHNHRIRKVDQNTGRISTIAGDGTAGFNGDNRATSSRLNYPAGVAVDAAGNVCIADQNNHRIRKVTPDGWIQTVAGSGTAGWNGDGTATSSYLYHPFDVAVDASGNVCIADRYNHRIRQVRTAGQSTPDQPETPSADLYGEPVAPGTVQQGQLFGLGVRVRSWGPAMVEGGKVTVTLTLPSQLVGVEPGCSAQQCTRSFPGAHLLPNQGSLDGVFQVIARPNAAPGTYWATVRIDYAGDTRLVDNVFTIPVNVVVPAPVSDETDLTIKQAFPPQAKPGTPTLLLMEISSASGQPVNPGVITQTFTAPTGFAFTGQPFYGYYDSPDGVVTGHLESNIQNNGTTVVVTGNPHVNTTSSDRGTLTYTFPLRALDKAQPGTRTDGRAVIGRHAPVPLTGTILPQTANDTAQPTTLAS
ncbi:NHL repeat-containing protein, partial [Streptomyces sp. NPDC054834]